LLPLDPGDLASLLASLTKQGQVMKYDPERERYLLTATARQLDQEIKGILSAYHRKNPLKPGLSKEELRRQLPPQLEVRLFNQLLGDLAQKQQIAVEKDLVRLTSHRVTLAVDQEEHVHRLAGLYQRGQLSPPTLKEAAGYLAVTPDKVKQLLTVLVNQGRLVKV
jgi:selenocysteine-specific elongation factor